MHNSCYTKSCLDAMVCMLHPLHKCDLKPITKTMKVSLLNLFPVPFSSTVFSISLINESLFRQEMRFSFPLLLFVHLSPLSSSPFALHPHLTLVSPPSQIPFSSLVFLLPSSSFGLPFNLFLCFVSALPAFITTDSTTTTKPPCTYNPTYIWIAADILFTQNEQCH